MTFQKKGAIWHYMKTTLGVGDNYITPYSIDRDKEGSRNLGLEVTSLKQKNSLPNGPHADSDTRLSVVGEYYFKVFVYVAFV